MTCYCTIKFLLQEKKIERLEAEILLAEILKKTRSYLHTHPEQQLTFVQHENYRQLLQRRLQGEPIAYLIGKREFWSLNLKVTPEVLIPRHETELLVEKILTHLSNNTQYILELGTGSGAIAIALAHSRPQWFITATDNSFSALAIAEYNAKYHGLNNIQFKQSDWFNEIPLQYFDVIVSNPPYLSGHDPHLIQGDLRFEPLNALVAKDNGFSAFKKIIHTAPLYLRTGGYLFLEHGYTQAETIQYLLSIHGFSEVITYADLAGLPRVTGAKMVFR